MQRRNRPNKVCTIDGPSLLAVKIVVLTSVSRSATQTALDPRRLGKQNSGFSDEDLADIICVLVPSSSRARSKAYEIARESSHHLLGGGDDAGAEYGLAALDDDGDLGLDSHRQDHRKYAIALRLSARVKDPLAGFTFGRNANKCDICFTNDPHRRLSNVHFRIFYNEYGVLMLKDRSTNGTIVNRRLLRADKDPSRVLNNGDTVEVLSNVDSSDLEFIVRIPKRQGDSAAAWNRNFKEYMARLRALSAGANATITPGPQGPVFRQVDLFPAEAPGNFKRPQRRIAYNLPDERTQDGSDRLSNDWTESERYHRVCKIGQGAFATVYKVTDKFHGVPYAAKELDKRKFVKNGVLDQKVENEMNIMQRIKHPNIVGYIDHLDWDERRLIIIMEYVPGGDLGSLIQKERPLNEDAVRTMATQLLGALGYLHEHNITHRDVKPDNILISSQQPFVVKLTDFGLSKMVDSEQTFLTTFCGTLLYCAPEVYTEFDEYDEFGHRNPRNRQRRPRGQRYDHAVDIWSLGGVLFYALTGCPPYPVKAGISYTELLYQIMTRPLDVSPLVRAGISGAGIDFIRRMLNRRPEQRATVETLENHPWLGGPGLPPHVTAGDSYDEISDDGLDHQASQLSLNDSHGQGTMDDPMPDGLEEYYDENDGTGYESEKENYTFGAVNQGPQRLFGEVNVSAIGSSGVIPAERLNLPVSANSLATTDIVGDYEVRDSFDSEDTPKGKQTRSQPDSGPGLRISVLSASQSRSVNDLNNMTFDVESQDLGGAESIMENLNMRSLAASHFPSHDSNYFSTSKRKTSYENSDGSQSSVSHDRPVIKRFKSEALMDSMTDYSSDDDGEFELLAHVPPVARARSSRQMDEPVNKSTYWTAGDRKSYHLRYPEMTQFQLDAFRSAAAARGEEFGPGKTPLWNLAMKYFPPTHYEQVVAKTPLDVETLSNASGDVRSARPSGLRQESHQPDTDIPPTAGPDPPLDDDNIPDTLVPSHHTTTTVPPLPNPPGGKRIVASLESTPSSVIQGISLHLTESLLSWGRKAENTRIYEDAREIKIPKHAFKILLWKPGFDAARDFRPWNQRLRGPGGEEEAAAGFHFYISTKSTRGIFVNSVLLPSCESRNPGSPSRNWMRLHDGDVVVVWTGDPSAKPAPLKTELLFRCAWGGSARPRGAVVKDETTPPAPAVPALVDEATARKLDELCARAEKRVKASDEHDFKIAEAEIDRNERAEDIGAERERSRVFEARRVEAWRALKARGAAGSRRGSPAVSVPGGRGSPAPVVGQRTVALRARGSAEPGAGADG
ncbi:hypothetical protein CONLIGDRAFT_566140 [Coniochaeta ligniaria NRRL 30616]|uniref:Autophagy-related protein 1 n=1 Tax=Coniochaeta ligniaria NRRL 30616 TaxID=1408157 RepID=A0A1J7J816_9PEZI|nr:hypothetical protein CONLIGDRAFT_566140 [Coniochaeta ligniaria NRRL 30616]